MFFLFIFGDYIKEILKIVFLGFFLFFIMDKEVFWVDRELIEKKYTTGKH